MRSQTRKFISIKHLPPSYVWAKTHDFREIPAPLWEISEVTEVPTFTQEPYWAGGLVNFLFWGTIRFGQHKRFLRHV
ncbi:Hypp3739 [Branchiostoma lanceolatum]|uniref:Hypp3739 protein n=1 Tax=Branchiostoma lanceolatum TaxID=7740 RepID=A0A8K0A193_BRALA|nr:Hypp3739 [Branchiostoma lanceolatum]